MNCIIKYKLNMINKTAQSTGSPDLTSRLKRHGSFDQNLSKITFILQICAIFISNKRLDLPNPNPHPRPLPTTLTLHQLLQMLVEHRCIQSVEQVVAFLFVFLEELQVLVHALLDRHLVVVTNGIFTEEIKHNHILFTIQLVVERDVLVAERAATDGIGLIFVFFVT